jgi:hypothetical protein
MGGAGGETAHRIRRHDEAELIERRDRIVKLLKVPIAGKCRTPGGAFPFVNVTEPTA